ncbi:MAG: hypothetical protein GXO71_05930 [Caldiserica bacterium]|nr:hypothetical protein [Caldisericota bacterium]
MAENLFSFCKLFPDKVRRAFLVNLSHERLMLDKRVISLPFVDFVSELSKIGEGK